MDRGTDALVLFYSFFWAAALSVTGRYEPFDTPSVWAGDRHARKRFGMALVWLNVFPAAWFIILYRWVIPAEPNLLAAVAAAISSLSVFGFHRILHAIIASDSGWPKYYATFAQVTQVRDRGAFSQPQSVGAHLGPGVVYVVGFPLLALGVALLFA